MAKPAKRKTSEDASPSSSTATSEASSTDAEASSTAGRRVTPPKAKAKATERAPSRYTPPTSAQLHAPSPRWVPVLMFALWGIGLAVIILNYMGVLPGGADDGNGWYLVAGLVSILAGIMVATQYR